MPEVKERREVEPWTIHEGEDEFTLKWRGDEIAVAPAKTPLGVVIDAACEFMDFCREQNFPQWCETLPQLMDWCLRRSWRQN